MKVSFKYFGSRIDIFIDGSFVISTFDIATVRKLQEGQVEDNGFGFSLDDASLGASVTQVVFNKAGDTYEMAVRRHVKAELEMLGPVEMPDFISPVTKYTCWSCGYRTLDELPDGSYEICKVCGWEEDSVQDKDPYYRGGANEDSLYEHQQTFLLQIESNPPAPNQSKDPAWCPVPEQSVH